MAIYSKKNQYMGVNAHANSWLQNTSGEWSPFHHDHITDLTRALNAMLPAGYEARSERSLQIKEVYPDDPTQNRRRYPEPDVSIFDMVRSQPRSDTPSPAYAPSLVFPLTDIIERDEETLAATIIYEIDESSELGRPITRIELLSPTNKSAGEGFKQYIDKRDATLYSGMPLIEIDYLHQQPPVINRMGRYPQNLNAHPYLIIVSDPRPSIGEGKGYLYAFNVDDPIPLIDIPLDHGEVVAGFDLGAVYNTTFRQSRTLIRVTDYEAPPLNLDSYSTDDQARIRDRQCMVKAMRESGHDLNVEGPFPIDAESIAACAALPASPKIE